MDTASLAIRVQTGEVSRGIGELDKLTAAGSRAERATDGLTASSVKLGRSFNEAGQTISAMRGTAIGAAIVSIGAMTATVYEASAAMERLRMSFDFSFAGKGAQEIAYVSRLSDQLGLNLLSTAQAYGKLSAAARGTSLAGEGARNIFESISKASVVMGLTTEQSEGALRALEQMISKGTVASEELRGQLGERLPGAFQIASRAMGVTTQELGKMLEQGQVISEDFLPKFARQLESELGDAADKGADRLDAATSRMGNAWLRLKAAIGESGVADSSKTVLNAATNDLNSFSEAMERAKAQGKGTLGQVNDAVGMTLGRTLGLQYLSDDFKTLDEQVVGTIKHIDELNKKIDSSGGRANLIDRADLSAANRRLENLTREQQRRAGSSSMNPQDARLAAFAKEFEERKKQEEALAKQREEFLKKYASDQEKVETAVTEARKKLGTSFTEDDEKRVRDSFAKKPKRNKDADLVASMQERLVLIGQETELEKVNALIKNGTIKTMHEEVRARAETIDRLTAEAKLRKEEAEATEEYAKKRERDLQVQAERVTALRDSNAELEHGIMLIGADEKATSAMALAKMQEAIARKESQLAAAAAISPMDEGVQLLREEIALMRQRVGLTQRKSDKIKEVEEQRKTAEEMQKVWDNFSQNVQRNLGDTLFNVMQGKFEGIGASFRAMLQRMLADAMAANLSKALFTGGDSGKGWVGAALSLLGGFGSSGGSGPSSTVGGVDWTSGFDVGVGKAGGGGVSPFSMQEVNELGPELLSSGGKDYLMMGSKGGNVTPNNKIGGTQVTLYASTTFQVQGALDQATENRIHMIAQQRDSELVEKLQRAGAL